MTKILFIHGFGTVGFNETGLALAEKFGLDNVIAPDLPHEPEKALDILEDIVQNNDVYIVGSSLGGFYAYYLANKYKKSATLVNPACDADKRAANLVGNHINYNTDQPFYFSYDNFTSLKKYVIKQNNDEDMQILLGIDDDVIPYTETIEFLKRKKSTASIKTFDDVGHRFLNHNLLCENIYKHINQLNNNVIKF